MANVPMKSLKLPGLSDLYTFLQNDTNLAVTGKAADAKKTGDALAPEYNGNSTYAVGEYVRYNGVVYKCNTAISTAEAWTAAHWTATNVAGGLHADVTDVKSAIQVLSDEFEPLEIVKNEYVKNSDGSFTPYAGWFRTNKVKLPDNAKRLLIYIPANTQYSAWYDANGDFISAINLVGGAGIKNFSIPTGAVYFAISNEMQYANSYRYWGNEKMIALFNFLSNDNVPNSTQTVTFTNGKPSSIVHKRNNVAVRTDEITYSGSTITETRTDNETGYWITITTNTQTLTTEVQ